MLLNKPLRIYIDHGSLHGRPDIENLWWMYDGENVIMRDKKEYDDGQPYSIYDDNKYDWGEDEWFRELVNANDMYDVRMACFRMKRDVSIEEFKDLIKHVQILREHNRLLKSHKPTPIHDEIESYRLLHYITLSERNIRIERFSGNNNKNTFDMIKIHARITRKYANVDFIKKHKKEIDEHVLSYLKSCKKFQKFNVSINYLKLTNLVLTKDDILEYTFELKH